MATVHTIHPQRVIIGAGALATTVREVDRLAAGRVFLVATGSAKLAADIVAIDLGDRLAARWGRPVVHTPVETTAAALALVRDSRADVVVAIGGGSAIGLSKALASRAGLPQIVVPTTYAGSEVTPVLGETENGVKRTRRDAALLPGTVIYDPDLTVSMPPGLTVTSAMNALAHAVEALWAEDATRLSDALATEAATGILVGLPEVLARPADVAARENLQQAAWLAGMCLAQTRMGLHHQLAHVLGGAFDLPHADLHTMLLPHVMAFNLASAPAAASRLERAVGGDPVDAARRLAASHDGPHSLRDLAVPLDQLDSVAERVAAAPYPNPRAVVAVEIANLLREVWSGR